MKKTLLSGSVYVFDYTVKLQIGRLEPDHVFKCYLRIRSLPQIGHNASPLKY
jgi:hypothetical protein